MAAFACVPALAQAECADSSCAQYEVEIPTSGGKGKPHNANPGGGGPTAEASTPHNAKTGTQGSKPTQTETENEEQAGAAPGNGGNGPSNNGGSSGGGGKGSEGLGQGKDLGGGTETGKQVSHSSGGSSPLVPILIAIAVLAAISIGAVIYRQRRQGSGGSGSPVSPKAG